MRGAHKILYLGTAPKRAFALHPRAIADGIDHAKTSSPGLLEVHTRWRPGVQRGEACGKNAQLHSTCTTGRSSLKNRRLHHVGQINRVSRFLQDLHMLGQMHFCLSIYISLYARASGGKRRHTIYCTWFLGWICVYTDLAQQVRI